MLKKVLKILENPVFIILSIFIFLSVFGLPFLWRSKRFSTIAKFVLTAMCIAELLIIIFICNGVASKVTERSSVANQVFDAF